MQQGSSICLLGHFVCSINSSYLFSLKFLLLCFSWKYSLVLLWNGFISDSLRKYVYIVVPVDVGSWLRFFLGACISVHCFARFQCPLPLYFVWYSQISHAIVFGASSLRGRLLSLVWLLPTWFSLTSSFSSSALLWDVYSRDRSHCISLLIIRQPEH